MTRAAISSSSAMMKVVEVAWLAVREGGARLSVREGTRIGNRRNGDSQGRGVRVGRRSHRGRRRMPAGIRFDEAPSNRRRSAQLEARVAVPLRFTRDCLSHSPRTVSLISRCSSSVSLVTYQKDLKKTRRVLIVRGMDCLSKSFSIDSNDRRRSFVSGRLTPLGSLHGGARVAPKWHLDSDEKDQD
jgi:hypothetical protein